MLGTLSYDDETFSLMLKTKFVIDTSSIVYYCTSLIFREVLH